MSMAYANLKRYRPIAILLVLLLGGCRLPQWCGLHALQRIPGTADRTASRYWENCPNTPPNATSEQKVAPKLSPESSPPVAPPEPPATPSNAVRVLPPMTIASWTAEGTEPLGGHGDIEPAAHWQSTRAQATSPPKGSDPLRLPLELPGADTPPLVAPSGSGNDPIRYGEQVKKMFPDIVLPIVPEALPDKELGVLGLEALHSLARENHPGLRAAAAAVETARGKMIQAGLPPNPNFGYEADTVYTINTPGYHGFYLQQTIITARKLGLAAEAAAVDYANASIELRKTWVTVNTEIRRAYFQVLAARQRVILAKALFELSDRAFQAQIKLVAAGEAAPYEPLQLRVFTTQVLASLTRAQQDALASWRVLAAAAAVPTLPPTALEGRIDCPVPEITYENALAQLRAVHTDIRMAENLVGKNRTLVTLADRTPIPDLNVSFVYQRDYTYPPGTHYSYNLMLGGAVPVFDRNQGGRVSARAELARASQLVVNTENQLTAQLATVYGTYSANRQLASIFQTDALRDQVRAYRGIYQRYLADPAGISFNDVIVAQQTIGTALNQYLDILQLQWQSTVDLGQLLQVDDLFQLGPAVDVAEFPQVN